MTNNSSPIPYQASSSSIETIFGITRYPYLAFDNSMETFFESTSEKEPWIMLDLGENTSICGLRLRPANTTDYDWHKRLPKSFTLYGSYDGSVFDSLYSASGTEYTDVTPGVIHEYTFRCFSYRYYKIVSHSDYYGADSSGNIYFIASDINFLKRR